MGRKEHSIKEKELRRGYMIDAAERVFFSRGYENASMDEVAREAGFTKRTIYMYFSSKEQIYYEIMSR
jgi:AcrR family transcriptional regulator